jgi:hypothetical protein
MLAAHPGCRQLPSNALLHDEVRLGYSPPALSRCDTDKGAGDGGQCISHGNADRLARIGEMGRGSKRDCHSHI